MTFDQRLLLVHAHPDDECIGNGATMAKYVAEGVGVTLVTCTGGEMGEILVPEMAHMAADKDDTLADQRRIELHNAMKILGVTDHRYLGGFKRYRDSGMQWHEDGHAVPADDVHDNAFWNADLTEAATRLVEVIREVRPQVMITYDEFCGYGHPDHIQAHRVTVAAFDAAGDPSYGPGLGAPWQPSKLYFTAFPKSVLQAGIDHLKASGDSSFFGVDSADDLPFGNPDEEVTTEVDAREHLDRKVAAMRAHATQIEVDGPFFALSNNQGNAIWGSEYFRIAKGVRGPLGDDGLEHDLFAGLE